MVIELRAVTRTIKPSNLQHFLCAFLVYILVLAFLFRNLDFTKMWSYGDLNPFTKHLIEWALFAWRDEGLGYQYISQNYLGLLLLALLTSALGGVVAQKVAILLPFLTSFITAYFFLKSLLRLNFMLCFTIAVLYSINPVTMMVFVGGSLGSLMVYSLIPLISYLLIKFLESYRVKYILLIIIFSPFFWNLYVTFWIFLLLLLSIFTAELLIRQSKRILKNSFACFVALSLCLILIFSPTLIQLYYAYQKTEKNIMMQALSDVLWNYKDANIFNLLRFAGNYGSAQSYLGYNSFNYFTWAGTVLEILALFSLLIFKKAKKVLKNKGDIPLIIFVFSWISLITSTTMLILIKEYPHIVSTLPLMATLRSPAKLMYVIAFNLMVLISITLTYLHSILMRVSKRHGRVLSILFALILFLLIFTYNMPVTDGTYGLSLRGHNYYVNSKYYVLRSTLETVCPTYSSHRILIMPFDYPSLMDMRATLPNYFGLTIGPFINASGLKEIYKLLISHEPYKSHLLALFDVKLVIIDKSFHSPYEKFSWYRHLEKAYGVFVFRGHGSYFIGGNASMLKDMYLEDPYFKLIYNSSDFVIFENTRNISRVYIIPRKVPFRIIVTTVQLTGNIIRNSFFKEGLKYWKAWPGKCALPCDDCLNGYSALLLRDCDSNDKVWSIVYTFIPVKGGSKYELSFYIKFLNRVSGSHVKILWYNETNILSDKYSFKVDYVVKFYNMNITVRKWYHVEKVIRAPLGAKIAKLEFLVGPKSNTSILISNVSFIKVYDKIEFNQNIQPLIYKRKDPTTVIVRINSSTPFTLVFAEAYDPLWEARVYKNGELVEKVRSVPVYGVINGFWINETGNLTVVIRYVPQDWFELGLKISATTFALCVFYLVWDWRRGRGDRWAVWLGRVFGSVFRRVVRR